MVYANRLRTRNLIRTMDLINKIFLLKIQVLVACRFILRAFFIGEDESQPDLITSKLQFFRESREPLACLSV